MKSLLKLIFVSIFVLGAVGSVVAQSTTPSAPSNNVTLPPFNPAPCDFNDTFYADNGIDSSSGGELNTEPDGRFGNVINGVAIRKTGPPATGSQVNWVVDNTCATNDPTRRNVRILATTGGNADDGNSPFSCNGGGNPNFAVPVPQCPPPNGTGTLPASFEFISILAFLHSQNAFEGSRLHNVGFINGGLQGVQQNPGTDISIGQTLSLNNQTVIEAPTQNLRGISMQFIVSNFEAYASINPFTNTLQCPQTPPNGPTADPTKCTPAPGHFAASPCSVQMINNLQAINNPVTTLPQFCFNVADTVDSQGHTHSDVESPKLRQDWRFATNRNAMDGSDNNCINGDGATTGNCINKLSDSPFGYFCDDLLGMWIITYFWFTEPPNDPECGPVYQRLGKSNGFTPDGFPIILTANELNNQLEGHTVGDQGVTLFPCGSEGKEDVAGGDRGAVWLVCPALQDPRNGAITSDAFLDFKNTNTNIDISLFNQFSCLQKKGKFCSESDPGQ